MQRVNKDWSVYSAILIIFIAFNIWHATNRGIWTPMSIINSLHLSESTAKAFAELNPSLRASRGVDDSQQAFIMMHDLFILKRTCVRWMDLPQYRYRRIGYPLL